MSRRLVLRIALCAAIFAFVLVLAATAQGPGLSPDSIFYFSSGLNLASGRGLTTYMGAPLTIFPPGLPVIVALGEQVGPGAATTVRLVNASACAAIVLLAALLLSRHVRSRALVIGATSYVAVAVALLSVASYAWSEPLFIVATLAFVLGLQRALEEPQGSGWVVFCALLVWVAFGLRYSALVLIPVGGAVMFIGYRRWGIRYAAIRAGLFGTLACLAPALLMLRNSSVDGTLMGPRGGPLYAPAEIPEQLLGTLGTWLLPVDVPNRYAVILGAIFLTVLMGSLIWLLFNSRSRSVGHVTSGDKTSEGASLVPLVLWTVGYTGYLVAAELTTNLDPISTRLLVPVLVPLVVLTTVAIDRATPFAPTWLQRSAAVFLVGVVVAEGVAAVDFAHGAGTKGQGYASTRWRESDLAPATVNLPSTAVVYTNDREGLWVASRRDYLRFVPSSAQWRRNPDEFVEGLACTEAYLAWFDASGNWYGATELATPDGLAEVVAVETVGEFSDGTLYRLRASDVANCASSQAVSN